MVKNGCDYTHSISVNCEGEAWPCRQNPFLRGHHFRISVSGGCCHSASSRYCCVPGCVDEISLPSPLHVCGSGHSFYKTLYKILGKSYLFSEKKELSNLIIQVKHDSSQDFWLCKIFLKASNTILLYTLLLLFLGDHVIDCACLCVLKVNGFQWNSQKLIIGCTSKI